jgi:transposase-like protein
MQSQKRRQYTEEFKCEAVRLVTDHGYGVAPNLLERNFDVTAPDVA